MTVRPIDLQVILGKVTDVSIQQQELQNASVHHETQNEEENAALHAKQEEQVTQTEETEYNKVEDRRHGEKRFFKRQQSEKKSNAEKEGQKHIKPEDPYRGHIIDVKK